MDRSLQSMEQRADGDMSPITGVLQILEATLNVLADSVLHEQPPVRRKKLEHLVSSIFLDLLILSGFPHLLESPGFFFLKIPGPRKSLWSWKLLEIKA